MEARLAVAGLRLVKDENRVEAELAELDSNDG